MVTPDHIAANSSLASSAMDAFLAPFIKQASRERASKRSLTTKQGTKSSRDGRIASGSVALSVFDVPPGLLTRQGDEDSSLTTSRDGTSSPSDGSAVALRTTVHQPAAALSADAIGITFPGGGKGLTCIRCGLSFDARPIQLAHFKSKLHMTNLRRQLSGGSTISQEELDAATDSTLGATAGIDGEASPEEEDSSGSESDEASTTPTDRGIDLDDVAEEGEGDVGGPLAVDTVHMEVGGRKNSSSGSSSSGSSSSERGRVKVDFSLQEGPRLTFVPRGCAWCFSLSSAALGMERGDDPWERLDQLVGDEGGGGGGGANRLWGVVILRSGKFAAAVFEGQSVLCHKVFRRYTIRAKRGGSQSSYDSGGRKAQSAGAALRRYGEQALREDARALLKEWEGPLKACRVILTSVPKGMRAVLFEGKDAPFERKDSRLRPVPFAVGKPVFEEVVAVHSRVTSIVFSDAAAVTAADRPASDEPSNADDARGSEGAKTVKGGAAAMARDSAVGPAAAQQHTIDAAEPCPPSVELLEACERGDVDAAVTLLDRLDLDGDGTAAAGTSVAGVVAAPSWTAGEVINHPDGLERLMTPLHVTAAGGHVAVLGVLLERGANPLAEDVRGRVPYLLAANKDTRDAFRRARAGQPGRWDWDVARVPEPLTKELEQRQKEKQKEKEKEKKRRAKLRKKAEKERAEEEARQRKEKEEAEAEERRQKGLAAVGHCDACNKALIAKKAFSRFEFRYCSADCAQVHKRRLAADAAERRFNGGGGKT